MVPRRSSLNMAPIALFTVVFAALGTPARAWAYQEIPQVSDELLTPAKGSAQRRLLGDVAPMADGAAASTITKCLWSDTTGCTLNPSYMFTVQEAPDQNERVLQQITAMRYACLAHAAEAACHDNPRGWCSWDEGGSCSLYYDDADFVGLLLWSSISLACEGSLLADLVRCSFEVYRSDCNNAPSCQWLQEACYPAALAPAVSFPPKLLTFKRSVHAVSPAVWGACAGAEVYRRYAGACNYTTEAGCRMSSEGCHWLSEYEAEVGPNPLNLSKPCVLASTASPIESVLIGGGALSKAVVAAQQECMQRGDGPSCTKEQVPINSSALGDAMAFAASKTPYVTASWDPSLPSPPRLPLPLPYAGSNPLKRAAAAWWEQQRQRRGGPPGDGGGEFGGAAVAVPLRPVPLLASCPPGLAGLCASSIRQSQQKLRLYGRAPPPPRAPQRSLLAASTESG